MRPIEFRAWEVKKKRWWEWALEKFCVQESDSNPYHSIFVNKDGGGVKQAGEVLGNENFISCQWTGLLDKNGVKIFEGDVVREDKGKEALIENLEIRSVCWSEEDTGFYPFIYHGAQWFAEGCEVIGNIYENPELLGEKDDNVVK